MQAGMVMTHATNIFLKRLQSTDFSFFPSSFPFTAPTSTIEPTLQWVVEIGIPILLARSTVAAAPISIVKPLKDPTNFQNFI